MKKREISCILVIIMTLTAMMPSAYAAGNVAGSYISAEGAFVMDFETGEELYSLNPDNPRPPGSMTKIMSMYLFYESLEKGDISLETPVPVSEKVYWLSRNLGYINAIPLYYNTLYTVREMLDVIVVYSASPCVVAMAELVSGSEEAFVERMNAKALQMGLNAEFFNCAGVYDNFISPRSMATLARNIIVDYPDILQRSAQTSVYFHGGNYLTTNRLLGTYPGADGLKTGTSQRDGLCLCGTAERNGVRIIAVGMGSTSSATRTSDVATLMDYGFSVMRSRPKELTHPADIAEELTLRGIISPTDKDGFISAMWENTNGRLYWLARKGLHRIRLNDVEPVFTPERIDSVWVIANDLTYRGIVSDLSGLLAEMNGEPGGMLYMLARDMLHYMRLR